MFLSGSELLLAVIAVTLASVVQGVSGVGGGFIAVPLLAMIDVRLLPGPLIFGSLAISGVMAWHERAAIDYHNVGPILLATLPGAAVGAWLLTGLDPDRLGLAFGSVILLAAAVTVSGVRLPLNRFSGALAGAAAGAMAAVSGMGAPMLAILYQHESGPRVRATLALLYTGATVLILIALASFDRFGLGEAVAGLLLVPGYLVGYALSRLLTARVDRGATRVVVLAVSVAAAVALIIDSL